MEDRASTSHWCTDWTCPTTGCWAAGGDLDLREFNKLVWFDYGLGNKQLTQVRHGRARARRRVPVAQRGQAVVVQIAHAVVVSVHLQ